MDLYERFISKLVETRDMVVLVNIKHEFILEDKLRVIYKEFRENALKGKWWTLDDLKTMYPNIEWKHADLDIETLANRVLSCWAEQELRRIFRSNISNDKDVKELVKGLRNALIDIDAKLNSLNVNLEDVDSKALDISWYKQILNKRCYKLRWHYLNDVLGGLMPGKLWTLVGKYKVGKTFFMLRMACDLWLEQDAKVLFCSAEMNNEELKLRLLSMIGGLPFTKIVQCSLTEEEEKRYEVALKRIESAKGRLYVLGRGEGCDLVNVEYIVKDKQIDVLFVDSFYLMGNAKSEYERVDQALGIVLNICKGNNIPVVVSTQFNREGAKMKADNGMDQSMYVAYNLNTVRLSDVVIGLLRDQMLAELKRMYVAILASRYSRSDVRFAVSWDMNSMEFEEVNDTPNQAEALDKYVANKIKEEYIENVEAG